MSSSRGGGGVGSKDTFAGIIRILAHTLSVANRPDRRGRSDQGPLRRGAIGETWRHADVLQAKADLIFAIYGRIVVAGPRSVSARLTPAHAHVLALALPQVVMARPTGVGPALTTYRIPIEGREEWEAAARARSA